MTERPKKGLKGVILTWIIGLTLGVAAGAATAMLLMPSASGSGPVDSLADRFRSG